MEQDSTPSAAGNSANQAQKPPEDNFLCIKPSCECENCKHWTKSIDWCAQPDFEYEATSKTVNKTPTVPLLRSATEMMEPGKRPEIQTLDFSNKTLMQRQLMARVLVHGATIPEPMDSIGDAPFHKTIYANMRNLHYTHSLHNQKYIWPAIFHHQDVFVIGGPKSGKTLSYLPVLSSCVLNKKENYPELFGHNGPIAVIMCPNSEQCEEIFDLFEKLFNNAPEKPRVSNATYPLTNIHNMDVLITTPPVLMECLRLRMFTLKRLCHLVLENASRLFKNHKDVVENIIHSVDDMLHRSQNRKKVQMIVASSEWSKDIDCLLKQLHSTPMVCIANHIEAAFYGKAQFEIKFLNSSDKLKYLEGLLKDKYHMYRTLVVADVSELSDISNFLSEKGIDCASLTDSSNRDDIQATEEMWRFLPCGQCQVLVCSDFVLDKFLTITDAVWLIHYSFPEGWKDFLKRFSSLSTNLRSPLRDNSQEPHCKTFIMMDETCERQKSKIFNLTKRMSKTMSEKNQKFISDVVEASNSEQEKIKVRKGFDICEKLKLFGRCRDPFCKGRHVFDKGLDTEHDLPKNGKIIFKILRVKDVTCYIVQLLRHQDLDGNITVFTELDATEGLKYPPGESAIKMEEEHIKIEKFYAHCDYSYNSNETHYTLCRVVKIQEETFVEVQLMNTLKTLQTLKSKLYQLPSSIKIVEIYLCNLLPPFKDDNFSHKSLYVTRSDLQNVSYKEKVLTGDVHLQLNETFWVSNVVEKLKSLNGEVIKYNLTKKLRDLKVVEMNTMQISLLYKLCKQCNISLPCYIKQKPVVRPNRQHALKYEWAFLDGDGVDEVFISSAISPNEFYVRLSKFQKLLDNLQKEIQETVTTKLLDNLESAEVGKCYLAKDPQGIEYSRALVLNTENEKALCYYVDYGDEAVVNIRDMKILPNKLLNRLPFQAIQCTLQGVLPAFREWDDNATDVLYKYTVEPETEIFRTMFVKVFDKVKTRDVRSNFTYSVVLKDGFEVKSGSINQLLVDCGFARSLKIEDFEITGPQVSADWDEKIDISNTASTSNQPIDVDVFNRYLNVGDFVEEDFDFELNDAEEFLRALDVSLNERLTLIPQLHSKNASTKTESGSSPSKDKSVESCSYKPDGDLTPEIFWSQTNNNLKLKIKIFDALGCKVRVVRKSILIFSASSHNTNYSIKYALHKTAEYDRHVVGGQEVLVYLKKIEEIEWPQLTKTSTRLRNVHYEVDERLLEEKEKRFLQLDIEDEESDDEDDNMMYVVESDLDSEYDQSIPSDSD